MDAEPQTSSTPSLLKKRVLPEDSSSDDCMVSSMDCDKASRLKSPLQPQRKKKIFCEITPTSSVNLAPKKTEKKRKDTI